MGRKSPDLGRSEMAPGSGPNALCTLHHPLVPPPKHGKRKVLGFVEGRFPYIPIGMLHKEWASSWICKFHANRQLVLYFRILIIGPATPPSRIGKIDPDSNSNSHPSGAGNVLCDPGPYPQQRWQSACSDHRGDRKARHLLALSLHNHIVNTPKAADRWARLWPC